MIKEQYNILGLSDSPLTCTGYASVTKMVFNHLSKKKQYNCSVLGHNYLGQTLHPPIKFEDGDYLNFKLYGTGREQYAKDILEIRLKELKVDLLWMLLDSFMLFPWLLEKNLAPAKSMFYFPSDGGNCLPSNDKNYNCSLILEKVDYPVSMSQFGQKQVKDVYGIKTDYIPHAVHTNVYYPLPEKIRQDLKHSTVVYGINNGKLYPTQHALKNKLVIGSVFRNQGRKSVDKMLKTFKVLLEKHKFEDFVFLAHTDPNDVASVFNILFVADMLKISHKIFFTGMQYHKGFPISKMNQMYNLFDIFFLSTSGEGFGIPTLEAMSCGIPCVVTDYTSTPELLVKDGVCGLPVKLTGTNVESLHQLLYDQALSTQQIDFMLSNGTVTGGWTVERGIMDINDAAEKILKLYHDPKLRERFGRVGREKAENIYSWQKVSKQWDEKIEKILTS